MRVLICASLLALATLGVGGPTVRAQPKETAGPPIATGGYRLAGTDGSVYAFGATYAGSAARLSLAAPIVGIASTPTFGY
jgi:hypothetical protein